MSANVKTQINWKEILERSKQTEYNIYDLVPMQMDNLLKVINEEIVEAEVVDEDDVFADLEEKIETLKKINHDNFEKYQIVSADFDAYIQKLAKTYNKARKKVFKKLGEVPLNALESYDELTIEKEEDIITKATLAPRARLSDLKILAEKLGFMIIPWEYHNKDSFKNESKKIKNAIYEFEKLEKYLDLYVISPINYWDIEAHIKAKNPNKYIFRSSKIKNIVSSVEIQLPVLRQFHQRITKVEKVTEALVQDQKQMQDTINSMQKTLDKVVIDIAQIWKEISEMKEDIKEAKELALESLNEAKIANSKASSALSAVEDMESMFLRAIDPMLFAVPKDHDMEKDCYCIIGPVWGPDFSWLVAAAENIEPIIGQRKLIEKFNPFYL